MRTKNDFRDTIGRNQSMKKSKRNYELITPHPAMFGVFLVLTLVTFGYLVAGVPFTSKRGAIDHRFSFPLFLYYLCYYGKFYLLDDYGIRFFTVCVPRGRLSWDSIKAVLYFEKSNNLRLIAGDPVFLIVTKGCESYNPQTDNPADFMKIHKGFVYMILPTKKGRELYFKWFQKYFDDVIIYD
jgi:hypothetical protein